MLPFCLHYSLYLSEGFLHLQNLVGMSIIEWRVNKFVPGHQFTEIAVNTKVHTMCLYYTLHLLLQQFPYPPHSRNIFLENIEQFMPLLIVLSLIWSAGIFVWVSSLHPHTNFVLNILTVSLQELVSEKQSRMRESMKMMGLSNWILWLTWYVKQFLFLMITVIIMAILIKVCMYAYNYVLCTAFTAPDI